MVASVNMGNAPPSTSDISSLIPSDGGDTYDVVVVGMQEATWDSNETNNAQSDDEEDEEKDTDKHEISPAKSGKKAKIPRRSSLVTKIGKGVRIVEETMRGVAGSQDTGDNKFKQRDRKKSNKSGNAPSDGSQTTDSGKLNGLLSSHLPSYTPVVRYQRGEMRLHIYVRTMLVPALTDVEVTAENTGLGHVLANKGGIAARVTFTDTSLSFVSCHLSAHEGRDNYLRRCADISEILSGTKLGNPKRYDVSIISHHTFFFGDLNFRVDFGGGKKENKEKAWGAVERGDFGELYQYDELQRGICNGDCLDGFREGDCSQFAPTFKVKRRVKGTVGDGGRKAEDVYNPQRTPSYCDRILFRSLAGLKGMLKQTALEGVSMYTASDHNPVRAMFTVDVPLIISERMHVPSGLMSRKTKSVRSGKTGGKGMDAPRDSVKIMKDYSAPEFDLDHPENTPGGEEEVKEEGYGHFDIDKICKLTFSSMRCMNLTEMDSKLAGGGSDPYIQFVPLTDHLLKKQHNQQKRHTMTSNAFYQYPKTKVTRHNVNPVFQDIIELEVDVAREKDLLNGKFLALTVMDHDDLSEDDLIGTVVFNLASLTGADTGDGVRVKSTGRITRLEISKPVLKDCKVQGHFEGTVEMCWVDRKLLETTRSIGQEGNKGGCCVVS